MSDSYLSDLNESQRQTVETADGSALILVGASAGKTPVLTCRVAYLILEKKIEIEIFYNPRKILYPLQYCIQKRTSLQDVCTGGGFI